MMDDHFVDDELAFANLTALNLMLEDLPDNLPDNYDEIIDSWFEGKPYKDVILWAPLSEMVPAQLVELFTTLRETLIVYARDACKRQKLRNKTQQEILQNLQVKVEEKIQDRLKEELKDCVADLRRRFYS